MEPGLTERKFEVSPFFIPYPSENTPYQFILAVQIITKVIPTYVRRYEVIHRRNESSVRDEGNEVHKMFFDGLRVFREFPFIHASPEPGDPYPPPSSGSWSASSGAFPNHSISPWPETGRVAAYFAFAAASRSAANLPSILDVFTPMARPSRASFSASAYRMALKAATPVL